jgi:hypothetical protein
MKATEAVLEARGHLDGMCEEIVAGTRVGLADEADEPRYVVDNGRVA